MKRSILLLLTIATFILNVSAQSKRAQLKRMGDVFYQEDFNEVMDLCVQFEKEFPKETDHLYYKYIAELLTIDRAGDIDRLIAFESSKGKTDKFYNYWMGRIRLRRYEFREAKEHLDAFMRMDIYKSNIILRETRAMLNTIQKAQPYYDDPDEYELEPLPKGINSMFSEVSPAFFNGHEELVFASNRHNEDTYHEAEFYTIYHSVKNDGTWSDPTEISVLGKVDYEYAKMEIINENNRLYMYSPENSDLIYSEFKNNNWSAPKEFDSNLRNRYVESHFFINDAQDLILFVKDFDIWQTNLVNGAWSTPKKIPGKVNTGYSEESPFLSHYGDVLYFSSNRPESMGGYDVFKSKFDSTSMTWSEPVNMGFPINTIDDDINFEVTPSDQSGYLSSNRLHSVGSYDIYYFHIEGKIAVKGVVTDLNTGKPAVGVEVQFRPVVYTDEIFRAFTNSKGEFSTLIFNQEKFETEIKIQGQTLYEGTFESYIPTDAPNLTTNFEVKVPAQLKPKIDYATLYEGDSKEDSNVEVEMIGSKFRGGRKAIVQNIYFDFQSANITSADTNETLQLILTTLTKSSDLQVEIGGHTDNIGSKEYNQKLSQQRADAVRNFLISKGIDPTRLKAVGYGESYPLASNDDEKDGRELNRRIEIRVLE